MEDNYIEKLIGAFMALPGVGYKTAQRYAYYILAEDGEKARRFAETIIDVRSRVKFCSVCGGYATGDKCDICSSRDSRILCVVKDAKDISTMERVKNLGCLYHVLHGTISPLENRGPEDIRIKELLGRVQDFDEIILATNPDIEGEATAMYIARLLKPFGVKVTRLAQGIAMGSDLEYADDVTLTKAIEERREM